MSAEVSKGGWLWETQSLPRMGACTALARQSACWTPAEHGWRLDSFTTAWGAWFADPRVDVSNSELIHMKRQHRHLNVSWLIVFNCPELGLLIRTTDPKVPYLSPLSETLEAGSVSEFRIC